MSDQAPCPDKILDDCGGAFSMGAIGGSAWHLIKGMKNSPRGDRIRGGISAMSLRAPTLGGNFAVWGGLFSFYDCGIVYLRRKEDPWNAIISGALTGGTLALRAGWKSMGKNAAVGGVLLAIIEGLGSFVGKYLQPQQTPPIPLRLDEKPSQYPFLANNNQSTSSTVIKNSFSPDYALQEMSADIWDDENVFQLGGDLSNELAKADLI